MLIFFVFNHRDITITLKYTNMQTQDQVKEMVRQKYGEIALQDKSGNENASCIHLRCLPDACRQVTFQYYV